MLHEKLLKTSHYRLSGVRVIVRLRAYICGGSFNVKKEGCWKYDHTSATLYMYKCNPKQELPGGLLGGRFSLTKNGGTSMKVLSIEEHGETEPIVCLFKIEL